MSIYWPDGTEIKKGDEVTFELSSGKTIPRCNWSDLEIGHNGRGSGQWITGTVDEIGDGEVYQADIFSVKYKNPCGPGWQFWFFKTKFWDTPGYVRKCLPWIPEKRFLQLMIGDGID